MFNLLDAIQLKNNISEENLNRGDIGTILEILNTDPGVYDVEFIDENGRTITILTLSEDEIEIYSK